MKYFTPRRLTSQIELTGFCTECSIDLLPKLFAKVVKKGVSIAHEIDAVTFKVSTKSLQQVWLEEFAGDSLP